MLSQDSATHPAELESITSHSVGAEMRLFRVRAVLTAAIATAFALALSTAARAATITVNSLGDPGAAGICALRDAITAANTQSATNGCKARSGNDSIKFSVTGTIQLTNTLPEVTDSQLTIKGPASPGITIGGGSDGRVMQVASAAKLSLDGLTISGGISYDLPGGALLNHGALTITDSTFSSNTTLPGFNPTFGFVQDHDGGAIYNDGALTVTSSTFSGNFTIFNVDACEVSRVCSVGAGGAIFNVGTLNVSNSTFSDNGEVNSSGGAIANGGTMTVRNSTFSENEAIRSELVPSPGGGFGGAISGGGTIINSTFSGNRAFRSGGAIEGGGTITSSTFSDNISENFGGSGGTIDGSASLKNTILGGSTNGFNGPVDSCSGTITDADYNISDDNSCNFSATGSLNNTNPMLSSDGLTNNGGPTQTIALAPGSPAIDAIPVTECTDQNGKRLKTDERGFPRPDAGENVCDVGAFETQDGCSQNQQGNNNCQ